MEATPHSHSNGTEYHKVAKICQNDRQLEHQMHTFLPQKQFAIQKILHIRFDCSQRTQRHCSGTQYHHMEKTWKDWKFEHQGTLSCHKNRFAIRKIFCVRFWLFMQTTRALQRKWIPRNGKNVIWTEIWSINRTLLATKTVCAQNKNHACSCGSLCRPQRHSSISEDNYSPCKKLYWIWWKTSVIHHEWIQKQAHHISNCYYTFTTRNHLPQNSASRLLRATTRLFWATGPLHRLPLAAFDPRSGFIPHTNLKELLKASNKENIYTCFTENIQKLLKSNFMSYLANNT